MPVNAGFDMLFEIRYSLVQEWMTESGRSGVKKDIAIVCKATDSFCHLAQGKSRTTSAKNFNGELKE
jgi:hypothetical protein